MASKARQIKKKKKAKVKVERIGHAQAKVTHIEIDDPFYNSSHTEGERGNSRKIRAAFNMNESPAALWKSKGTIDEAQLKAATRFRFLWETSGGSGASALDYSAVKVDTSGIADPVSERQLQAVMELEQCRLLLGDGFEIVQRTCGECQFVRNIYPKQYERKKQAKIARDMLDVLAHAWGYKSQPIKAHRAA